MNSETIPAAITPDDRSRWQQIAPVMTLLLLSPIVGEVLSGATRISYIFVLVPEIMVWGCGTLIIREAARRWQAGGTSLLLLGLALSVAEEFIIQQTSLAPPPWLGTTPIYGRAWGVNWVFFLFMLGYETVWIVLVPIQITELLFPARRNQPWLRARGLMTSGLVFVLGSFFAWYLWIKRARPIVFHAADYQPPLVTILLGALAIVVLVLAAFALRKNSQPKTNTETPPPWLAAVAAIVMGFPWYALITLVFVPRPIPFWIPMLAGIAWAAMSIALIRFWSHTQGWNDLHRWALCFGALLVCMVAGFSGSSVWPKSDRIGKLVLNLIAVVGMVALARRIQKRRALPTTTPTST